MMRIVRIIQKSADPATALAMQIGHGGRAANAWLPIAAQPVRAVALIDSKAASARARAAL